jgi:O-antigen ligase
VIAAGLVAVALLAAGALVAPTARVRAVAMAATLVAAPLVLVADVWDTESFEPVRDRPAVIVLALLAGVGVAVAGGAVLRRRPEALPLAVAVAVPFRVPVSIGGTTASLLVPLYGVIAAGAAAHAVRVLREPPAAAERRPSPPEWALAAVLVLYAVQATYSSDVAQAVQNVAFFYAPFAVLFALLLGVRWTPALLRRCVLVLVVMALLLCAIAFAQTATGTVFWNEKLREGNAYNPWFRANSLFYDPNVFGRFLAVVAVLAAAVAAWSDRARDVRAAVAALVVLWLGLLTTLSESSMAALLVGVVVLAASRRPGRLAAPALTAVALAAVAFVVAFPSALGLSDEEGPSLDKATSGRSELVSGGLDLFAERPALGWGSGAFSEEYDRLPGTSPGEDVTASHTIPLTVAVEQGVVGLGAYLALLATAFALLLRGIRRSVPRAAVAAAFAAVVLHTMGYAAFLEDPLTWVLLATGVVLAQAAGVTAARAARVAPGVAPQRSSSATSVSPTSMNLL